MLGLRPIDSSSNYIESQELTVQAGKVTSDLFAGKDLSDIRQNYNLHADGFELLTRQDTTVANAAAGTLSLGTTAFDGKTGYLTFLKKT